MAEKTIKTRIQERFATLEEWQTVWQTFIPLKGEVCKFQIPANAEVDGLGKSTVVRVLTKTGDGETLLIHLPWDSALCAEGLRVSYNANPENISLDPGTKMTVVSSATTTGHNKLETKLVEYQVPYPETKILSNSSVMSFQAIPGCKINASFYSTGALSSVSGTLNDDYMLYYVYIDHFGEEKLYTPDLITDKHFVSWEIEDGYLLLIETVDDIDEEYIPNKYIYCGVYDYDGEDVDLWMLINPACQESCFIYTQRIVDNTVSARRATYFVERVVADQKNNNKLTIFESTLPNLSVMNIPTTSDNLSFGSTFTVVESAGTNINKLNVIELEKKRFSMPSIDVYKSGHWFKPVYGCNIMSEFTPYDVEGESGEFGGNHVVFRFLIDTTSSIENIYNGDEDTRVYCWWKKLKDGSLILVEVNPDHEGQAGYSPLEYIYCGIDEYKGTNYDVWMWTQSFQNGYSIILYTDRIVNQSTKMLTECDRYVSKVHNNGTNLEFYSNVLPEISVENEITRDFSSLQPVKYVNFRDDVNFDAEGNIDDYSVFYEYIMEDYEPMVYNPPADKNLTTWVAEDDGTLCLKDTYEDGCTDTYVYCGIQIVEDEEFDVWLCEYDDGTKSILYTQRIVDYNEIKYFVSGLSAQNHEITAHIRELPKISVDYDNYDNGAFYIPKNLEFKDFVEASPDGSIEDYVRYREYTDMHSEYIYDGAEDDLINRFVMWSRRSDGALCLQDVHEEGPDVYAYCGVELYEPEDELLDMWVSEGDRVDQVLKLYTDRIVDYEGFVRKNNFISDISADGHKLTASFMCLPEETPISCTFSSDNLPVKILKNLQFKSDVNYNADGTLDEFFMYKCCTDRNSVYASIDDYLPIRWHIRSDGAFCIEDTCGDGPSQTYLYCGIEEFEDEKLDCWICDIYENDPNPLIKLYTQRIIDNDAYVSKVDSFISDISAEGHMITKTLSPLPTETPLVLDVNDELPIKILKDVSFKSDLAYMDHGEIDLRYIRYKLFTDNNSIIDYEDSNAGPFYCRTRDDGSICLECNDCYLYCGIEEFQGEELDCWILEQDETSAMPTLKLYTERIVDNDVYVSKVDGFISEISANNHNIEATLSPVSKIISQNTLNSIEERLSSIETALEEIGNISYRDSNAQMLEYVLTSDGTAVCTIENVDILTEFVVNTEGLYNVTISRGEVIDNKSSCSIRVECKEGTAAFTSNNVTTRLKNVVRYNIYETRGAFSKIYNALKYIGG